MLSGNLGEERSLRADSIPAAQVAHPPFAIEHYFSVDAVDVIVVDGDIAGVGAPDAEGLTKGEITPVRWSAGR